MREIKFRVWDEDRRLMTEPCGIGESHGYFEPDVEGPSIDLGIAAVDSLSYQVMQYTGLKDKNGREIYEGDILLLGCSTNPMHYVRAIVVWREDNDPGFGVTFIEEARTDRFGKPVTVGTMHSWVGSHSCLSQYYATRYHEVIGNIHENPELLEEKASASRS